MFRELFRLQTEMGERAWCKKLRREKRLVLARLVLGNVSDVIDREVNESLRQHGKLLVIIS
jgi:hypothetical protein